MEDNKISQFDEQALSLKLLHPRRSVIKCWDELLNGCITLSSFIGRVEKFSEKIRDDNNLTFFDTNGKDGSNKFKGDVFEIFSEYLLLTWGKYFGIYNYKPFFVSGEEQDTGVDGIGSTSDGRVVTVQIKYGCWGEHLENYSRRLHTFHWTSLRKYRVGTTSKDQMFIVTLAEDINYRTLDDFFHGRLKFITQLTSGGNAATGTNKPLALVSIKDICTKAGAIFFPTFQKMIGGK